MRLDEIVWSDFLAFSVVQGNGCFSKNRASERSARVGH